ncbi:MAG: hypothetical protein Q7T13_01550 [Polaromonas sp.]|nr:hypothetical protein [Polaromonas sp.]
MATSTTAAKTTAPKTAKVPAKLTDRVKSQLAQAVLRNKITVEELTDLETHIKKLAGFLA